MSKSSHARPALAGALLVLLAAPAASAVADTPTVTVRVEGAQATLLAQTPVQLDSNRPEPVSGCPGNSVAAAINLAVQGNWDHGEANSGGGDFTQTILGETHDFSHNSDTWAEWVDYKWGGGICSDILHAGDQVVMIADNEPPPTYAPTRLPLTISGAPSSVQSGAPFTVNVQEVQTPPNAAANPGDGQPHPIAGATVAGGDASATSGSDGNATLTLTGTGEVTLRATRSGDAPSASFAVCVHNGNDGNCGTTPGGPAAPAAVGPAAPYRGPFAVVAQALGVIDSHAYAPGAAPRVLGGRVSSASAITSVAIRLRRTQRGRCQAYSGRRERFFAVRCGQGSFFSVSNGPTFSYLLPRPLGPGRYVYDIAAVDAAGNRVALSRGSSRVVFYVR